MDLTKSPNKILVFSIAGVAVLIWILVWLFGPKAQPVKPDAKLPISLADLQPKQVPQEEEVVEETITGPWGRDPFATPSQAQEEEIKPPTQKGPPKARPQVVREGPQYKLSTILIAGSSRLVVINDKVYGVGDQIGGEKISKITLDHIVLSGAYGDRLLKVSQPQTQITVESAEGK